MFQQQSSSYSYNELNFRYTSVYRSRSLIFVRQILSRPLCENAQLALMSLGCKISLTEVGAAEDIAGHVKISKKSINLYNKKVHSRTWKQVSRELKLQFQGQGLSHKDNDFAHNHKVKDYTLVFKECLRTKTNISESVLHWRLHLSTLKRFMTKQIIRQLN